MWKKIAAIVATFAVFAAQTALALPPEGTISGPGLISKINIHDADYTFDFQHGDVMQTQVTFSQPVNYNVVIYDLNGVTPLYYITSSGNTTTANETDTLLFNGHVANGSILQDGVYQLTVSASATGSRTFDTKAVTFKVKTVAPVTPMEITSFTSTPSGKFNPDSSNIKFDYTLNKLGNISFSIYNVATNESYLAADGGVEQKSGSLTWDGKKNGVKAPAGDYVAKLEAFGNDGKGDVDSATLNFAVTYESLPNPNISVCKSAVLDGTYIKNFCADPSTWDPSNEELQIDWTLADDVDSMLLTAQKADNTGGSVELWSDEDMNDDDYSFDWDGLDEDGDYINQGLWAIKLNVEKGTYSETKTFFVDVSYSTPTIKTDNIFVTKDEFDNTIDETTSLIFKAEQESIVTVDVVSSTGKRVVRLWDEQEVSKKAWYTVEWDGTDKDGDFVDTNTNYNFKLTVENSANTGSKNTFTSPQVRVEEDTVSSSRANVTNDYIEPIILPKTGEYSIVTYYVDEPATITVEIFKGSKSSNPDVVLEKNVVKNAGTYSIKWDGKDKNGKSLDKDERYSYRVTASTGSLTDKERGNFVVGTAGEAGYEPTPTPTPTPEANCANYFYDVNYASPYCEAVTWAVENGIVQGYPNGTFKPYDSINRVEALKISLRAFGVPLLMDDGTNLGWTDVQVGSWYIPYLRTGKFLGMVNGYAGTTLVRPDESINRVELLKYVLEASQSISGLQVTDCNSNYYSDTGTDDWYSNYVCVAHDYNLYNTDGAYFAPSQTVSRGEVMLLLYRMFEGGLLI